MHDDAAGGCLDDLPDLIAARPRDRQVALMCDTRPLHRLIARLGGHWPHRTRPGCYRRPGEAAVIRNVLGDPDAIFECAPGRDVPRLMGELAGRIARFCAAPPDDGPDRRRALADIFARFHLIHPYPDGNGRIARLMVRGLCRLGGLSLKPRWTIAERPYGPAMGLVLRSYRQAPELLDFYFQRYF